MKMFYASHVKRWLDCLAAIVGLTILWPVIGLVGLVVWMEFGKPILFQQVRIGRGGKPFTLLKFRTMGLTTNDNGELLPDEERLTRTGRLLRSSSLDELPQLVNVLRGEMSLIGPRPLLPEYLPRYSARQVRRHEVRPGVTGLAQVSGRNRLDWSSRLELDVRYVESVSLLGDFKILLETVATIFRPREVSSDGHATMPPFTGAESEERNEPLAVIGAGGHGKVVAEALGLLESTAIFYDEDSTKHGKLFAGFLVRGGLDELNTESVRGTILAMGCIESRTRLAERFDLPWETVVHPDAVVSRSALIGKGVFIGARAVIGADAVIGDHAIINTGAVVDHDSVVGPHTHVAPGATITGGVRVGQRNLIGAGATILPGVTTGEDTRVGAGAVLTQDAPSQATLVGVPARPIAYSTKRTAA